MAQNDTSKPSPQFDDAAAVRRLLLLMGDDPQRGGLHDTPLRVCKALSFFGSGYAQKASDVIKCFNDGAEGVDEMVFQGGIPFWSMCEHHMLPFWGVVHVGYLPDKRVVGLSKFSRLIDVFARRLQVQERITVQIADAFMHEVGPHGVGVVIQARHTCMEARGVERAGSITTTTALRGWFKDTPHVKEEFLSNVRMAATKGF